MCVYVVAGVCQRPPAVGEGDHSTGGCPPPAVEQSVQRHET